MLHPFLLPFLPKIESLCREHRVEKLWAFGSVTRPDFNRRRSDVDLLVEFYPTANALEYGRNHLKFWRTLKTMLQKEVDLLTLPALRNPYFMEELDETKILIYEKKHETVPV